MDAMSNGLTKADIVGSWRIESMVEIPADGGPERFPFGPAPVGYFHFLDDDRVSSLVARGDRSVLPSTASDGERLTDMANVAGYSGTYKVLPDRIVVDVEICVNQALVGHRFNRIAKIVDGDLHLRTLPEEGAEMRLVWVRP
jgi:hypothetical protein